MSIGNRRKNAQRICRIPRSTLVRIRFRNGALGGKLIGAGGGGFLMFYTENKRRLLHAMLEQGLEEVRFRFDFEGSKTMIQ